MKQYSTKELTPVVYGEFSLKVLQFRHKANSECFKLHWHDRIELIRMRSGSINTLIDDREYTLKKDDLAIIYPAQPHRGSTKEQSAEYDVVMYDISDFHNNTNAGRLYLEPIINGNITFPNVTNNSRLIGYVDEIVDVYTKKQEANPLKVIGLVYEFLGTIYQCYKPLKVLNKNQNHNFDAVVEYVNSHFRENISTGELSEKFGYNESYFSRAFKKLTGVSLVKYIQILRLEYSQKLLKETDENIALIASKSGFSDIYYFHHCFKKHFGITPRKYRRNINGQII